MRRWSDFPTLSPPYAPVTILYRCMCVCVCVVGAINWAWEWGCVCAGGKIKAVWGGEF